MEQTREATEKSVYLAVLERASKYLDGLWKKSDVGIALMYFEETHGAEKVAAMLRFMNWAEEHDREAGWIAAQIGHDLNGCEDATMSPRTGGY